MKLVIQKLGTKERMLTQMRQAGKISPETFAKQMNSLKTKKKIAYDLAKQSIQASLD